jgi:acyl-CoA synthetase (NDP forming)
MTTDPSLTPFLNPKGVAVIDWARGQDYGISRMLGLGNQVDVCETDMLVPVVNVLTQLAQLAADHPQLAEIEINPLRVLQAGQGVVAVDVRIRVRK